MTQLIFNVKQFNIIKTTLFSANYKRNLNLFNYKESSMLTNAIKSRVETLKQIHENILKMQIKSINYQNKKIKNVFLLKKKIKYFFLQKILKEKNKNKKLKLIKIEAFFIKKIKGFKSYKLNLLKDVKIYLIFNIFLSKLINLNIFI